MDDSIFSKLQNKLLAEEECNIIQSAILTADILNHYNDSIREAILNWADGKDVTSFEIDGTKVSDIMEEINCSVFQALCVLDGIHANPEIFMDAVLVSWEDSIII